MSARRVVALVLAVLASSTLAALPVTTAQAVPDTTTYQATGGEQVYYVPQGTQALVIHAVGAPGGCPNPGGGFFYGGDVTATIPVQGVDVLYLEVGGPGGTADEVSGAGGAGGFNGGGAGGFGAHGGGGATDVRLAPADEVGSLDTRQVVAMGGGGGGANEVCVNASGSAGNGGEAGQEAGGTGGTSTGCANGDDGGVGTGGAGAGDGLCADAGGGGGGGGLYGGGGGGAGSVGAAGGSGSSAAPGDPSAVITTDTTGVPLIEITPVVAVAEWTPGSVEFGTGTVGRLGDPQAITMRNIGTAPLLISGLGIGGPQASDFFVSSSTCGAQVAPGVTCSIGISFRPGAAGPREATLVLTMNIGEYELPITGTAVSNQFSFVKVTRNKREGTAKLFVAIPGPGVLELRGNGIKHKGKVVSGPTTSLSVALKPWMYARLALLGELPVRARVTFQPDDGLARTKWKWVKLVLQR
ncbi:choice-of-anchor D domain-containing protein [Nocardioides agariphilus]|jgi:hypothetical protein|uniref:receptor protein-tyrosine kinase n=1 Tax=Nocardioides agariphilus TaxID=433664 RepID=A0A930VLJ2_9ACTN|nr:choice-of-anchor D domain-containing protein [Nocardioides agariphilus]MBF4769734.1 choice-of-anchor D domain-containing protein [Nocardioides agariphilus]